MTTTKGVKTRLECLTISSGLDQLPEEILIHILALVPYSIKSLRSLSQVCRRFRSIIGPSRPQSFFKYVAIEQFFGVYTILQILDDAEYDTYILDMIVDTHVAILYVLHEVKSNLSLINGDLEAGSTIWERDFLNSLLTWEFVSRLEHSRSLTKDDKDRLYQLLPPDTHMSVRYACAEVARCLFILSARWNTNVAPSDWSDGQYYLINEHRSVSQLTTVLEHSYPNGSRVGSLAVVLARCTSAERQARKESKEAREQFDSVIWSLYWSSGLGSGLSGRRGWLPGTPFETWLCDPKGTRVKRSAVKIFQLKLLIRRMVSVVNENGDLDPLEFMQTHQPLSTMESAASDTVDSSSKIYNVVFERNRANQFTRSMVKQALGEGEQAPADMIRRLAKTYDWGCALDTELLRGDSKLRRGLQPMSETLKQTSIVCSRV